MRRLIYTLVLAVACWPAIGAASEPEKVFEIIDGTSAVAGAPGNDSTEARAKWNAACESWKKELKSLNAKSEVLALSCSEADCNYKPNGTYVCSSTASYKLKIEGKLAPPPVSPAPPKTETVVTVPPPQVITEYAPAPMPGYAWIRGYWSWQGGRHVWIPGHWEYARPGRVWIGHEWYQRGDGWHLRMGRWDER